MKPEIHPSMRKCMVDTAGDVTIPDLSLVSHAEAHENYTQQVVAKTLREVLRFSKPKAERMAALYKGCPRVRLAKIMRVGGF